MGIPKSIAKRLSIPERVTLFNRDRMMKKVITGPDEIGGALYVVKQYDQSRLDLTYVRDLLSVAQELKLGDIVERMLENGDLVSSMNGY